MRYTAIALDFDGTIAHDSFVPPNVVDGLRRLKATGRKLILVTGRELPELLSIFPEITLFDRVVVENGALLYRPADPPEAGTGRTAAARAGAAAEGGAYPSRWGNRSSRPSSRTRPWS
jgi:HAD superfamily hydrolase (TIGR01484 family)